MCQCPGHGGQHHRGLQGEGGEGGRGAQPPLPGQTLPRPQHSLQAGVRNYNIVTHLITCYQAGSQQCFTGSTTRG